MFSSQKYHFDTSSDKETFLSKTLNNSSGMSLLEVMVVIGIMSIVIFGSTTLLTAFMRESKSLSDSLSIKDSKIYLSRILADNQVCTYELTSPSPKTFDPTKINTPNPPKISLNAIHVNPIDGAPAAVEVGKPLANDTPGLIVESILITNFQDAGVPDEYLADIQINLDNTKMIRSLKPLMFATKIQTTGPPNLKEVVKCVAPIVGSNDPYPIFNYITYIAPGTYSFNVPGAATKLHVKAWGAGSTGDANKDLVGSLTTAGGSSGAYAEGIYKVDPGATVNIKVGKGGAASPATDMGTGACDITGVNGEESTVNISGPLPINLKANGGIAPVSDLLPSTTAVATGGNIINSNGILGTLSIPGSSLFSDGAPSVNEASAGAFYTPNPPNIPNLTSSGYGGGGAAYAFNIPGPDVRCGVSPGQNGRVTVGYDTSVEFRNKLVINTPGTHSVSMPDGIREVKVQIWGAGASGHARFPIDKIIAKGGDGGGYIENTYPLDPLYPTTLTVKVGKGGTPNPNNQVFYQNDCNLTPVSGEDSSVNGITAQGGRVDGSGSYAGGGGIPVKGEYGVSVERSHTAGQIAEQLTGGAPGNMNGLPEMYKDNSNALSQKYLVGVGGGSKIESDGTDVRCSISPGQNGLVIIWY